MPDVLELFIIAKSASGEVMAQIPIGVIGFGPNNPADEAVILPEALRLITARLA